MLTYRKTLLFNLLAIALLSIVVFPKNADATSQWSRKYGISCNGCHSVFPRLNTFGEEFLRNGFKLDGEEFDGSLDAIGNLIGFRLQLTPVKLTTNDFKKSSSSDSQSRITFGNPNWIQFFVAGAIHENISFFSELQYDQNKFHFSWFYFNFTNLFGTKAVNFQVGNLSPQEFTAMPNRLRQIPNYKNQVMNIKSSDGKGESSVNMSSSRPGIQYFGYNDKALFYAGFSQGYSGKNPNQFIDYWSGVTLFLPDGINNSFNGSQFTLHYYAGTDTDKSGSSFQIENKFKRFSPMVNIRYRERFDFQAAYVWATEKNWDLVAAPLEDFKYSGIGLDVSYLLENNWHIGAHYDKYSSDDNRLDFHKIIPALSYIINENFRITSYFELDLRDLPDGVERKNNILLSLRTMF